MTIKSTTQFVGSSEEYTAPERPIDRIRRITAKLQPVNYNGQDRPRATPDPSVVTVVEPPTPGQVPAMADALTAAAEAVLGADLAQLLDSASFCAEVAKISPSDSAGLESAIRDFTPPATSGMAPNPAQGASSATVAAAPKNLLERLQMETEKALTQPLPPGSTVV